MIKEEELLKQDFVNEMEKGRDVLVFEKKGSEVPKQISKSGNSSVKVSSANRFDILTSLNDSNDNVIKDSAPVMDDDFIVDEEEVFIEPKKF